MSVHGKSVTHCSAASIKNSIFFILTSQNIRLGGSSGIWSSLLTKISSLMTQISCVIIPFINYSNCLGKLIGFWKLVFCCHYFVVQKMCNKLFRQESPALDTPVIFHHYCWQCSSQCHPGNCGLLCSKTYCQVLLFLRKISLSSSFANILYLC